MLRPDDSFPETRPYPSPNIHLTSSFEAMLDLRAGKINFGRYEYRRKIGSGGMGDVHFVHDIIEHKYCALKLIKPCFDCSEARDRLCREAAILRKFRHPNIVGLHDFRAPTETSPGYIVMEFVDGPDLATYLKSGPMPIECLVALVEQVCWALEVTHGCGVIHRDIKPSNIFVTTRHPDNAHCFKLGDFGVAKDLVDPDRRFETNPNFVVGTRDYIDYDVLWSGEASTRADLFAFGMVVAQAATGFSPRHIRTWSAKDHPETLNGLSAASSAVLAQALSPVLSKRPKTAGEFSRDFLASTRS